MHMTDDEHNEVAEMLRACESHIDAAGWFWLDDDLGGAHIVASSKERLSRGTALLADLIEPSCDRDALLALADELDGLGLTGFSSGWSSDAVNVGSFARRIREALGVTDG